MTRWAQFELIAEVRRLRRLNKRYRARLRAEVIAEPVARGTVAVPVGEMASALKHAAYQTLTRTPFTVTSLTETDYATEG